MTRNAGIDLVRCIAILAIVAGHVWTNPITDMLFFTWHVPVFFFLTGYLWRPGRSVAEETGRRARTLVKPYVFWIVLLLIPYVAVRMRNDDSIGTILLGPLYGGAAATRPFTTFWFVFVLFASAVLWRLLSSSPQLVRLLALAVALVASVVAGPELARTPLAIASAVPVLLFIASGEALKAFEPRLGRFRTPVALSLLAVSAILISTEASAPLNLKAGDWGTPIISTFTAIAISWSLVMLGMSLGTRISHRAGAAITSFALTGFTVVLAHPAVLWVLAPFQLPDILLFLTAIIAPALLGAVALRTPIAEWVTGVGHLTPERRPSAR